MEHCNFASRNPEHSGLVTSREPVLLLVGPGVLELAGGVAD